MANKDDKDLFRQAMAESGVIPRRYQPGAKTVQSVPPGVRVSARAKRAERERDAQTIAEEKFSDSPLPQPLVRTVDDTDTGNGSQFARAGLSKQRWKALRRGSIPIDESIDLHGMRRHEAERALQGFLAEAERYRWRCLEIIHGKGLGSGQEGGVLRPLTLQLLRLQPAVQAFCAAPQGMGGSGATLVLLDG